MVGELLIVTGPPGAGKSTLAPPLAEQRTPSVLIEGDEFFGFLRRGQIEPLLGSPVTRTRGSQTKPRPGTCTASSRPRRSPGAT